jgi:hypothetical protein
MDQKVQLCDPYVWEDPRYIFSSTQTTSVCASSLVNKIVFVYLVAILLTLVIGCLRSLPGLPVLAGSIATAYLIPTFIKLQQLKQVSENFTDAGSRVIGSGAGQITRPQGWGPMPDDLTGPKAVDTKELDSTNVNARNPFHNVMIDEYKYAPTRSRAPDITTFDSKKALDHFFRVQWSSDPTDVFGKTQSQRMFLTQPSSTIPNDQTSYQNWLYKIPGKTCKEGNTEACYGGTNGAALPWLNL